ncbi:hypothetical protein BGX28_000613 [Mortierella sp. GBA30]|nr:hypothetical protein BGX28_000613 [Mortierella sp. GBA30]
MAPLPVCRCLPSQSCWPSDSHWLMFNQTVGGRLITTKPPAYRCHEPHYDSAACHDIQQGYFFDHWRQTQPGAMQMTNWEVSGDKGCLGLNRTTPCYQGAVPLYSVAAAGVEDIQRAIRFASTNNIRLVIKNTGHDYIGRSIGAASLSLWVHSMKDIEFNDHFVPDGTTDNTTGFPAIILGAGVLWKDAYKAADAHNVTVVGGAEATVGASGGYCQGGGHGLLSPLYGLCVDNVLQYKVVTADAQVKIANVYQNKDLFWALRGGGGGTFGVVVEAIYRTHPALNNINYANFVIQYNETEARRSIINSFLSNQLRWSEKGWSGFGIVQTDVMIVQYYLPNEEASAANTSISTFLDYAQSLDNVRITGQVHTFPSFYSSFKSNIASQNGIKNAGNNAVVGSRLIPRQNFATPAGVHQLTDTLLKAQERLLNYGNPKGIFVTNLVAGGAVARGSKVETSVLPAWRKSLMHIWVTAGWRDSANVEEQEAIARETTSTTDLLRKITPGSGAYVNEADPSEPNWQLSFFGSNYSRLKAIKNSVDPHGLFACRNCVGSEDWSKDFICRATLPQIQ